MSDEPVEDPEGAEETLTARDAARGMGPAAGQLGGAHPHELAETMSVGEFMDGLPPAGLTASVYARGQWWHVSKLPEIIDGAGGAELPDAD